MPRLGSPDRAGDGVGAVLEDLDGGVQPGPVPDVGVHGRLEGEALDQRGVGPEEDGPRPAVGDLGVPGMRTGLADGPLGERRVVGHPELL